MILTSGFTEGDNEGRLFFEMEKRSERPVSIVDIAKRAGVSVATVSRVINQKGHYSPETERRVQSLIKECHYSPNMTAKRLRTKAANFIGVIVPDITNEFFANIVQKVQDGLLEHGYLALVCNTGESAEVQKQFLQMLGIVNLAGMIFISDNPDTQEYNIQNLPAVYIDRMPEEADPDRTLVIESDNYGGACMAVRELYRGGCRRIAFMRASQVISTHSFRQSGYFDQMARFGLEVGSDQLIKVDEVSFQAAKKKMLTLLDDELPFDGLFCATDWLAMGAVAALQERGIDVPGQVKVVGFDDISVSSLIATPLTTIHQQVDVLSQTAVTEILRLIRGEGVHAQRIQIDVSLTRRQTT